MAITILDSVKGLLDHETRTSSQHAIRTKRSWWALRVSSIDDWIHEWDVDLGSPNGHMDWPRVQKRGRQAVRLYCPNGKLAQIGDTHDATGRLFQFKLGSRNTSAGFGGFFQTDVVLSHVIGMVHGLIGECTLYAWEIMPAPDVPLDAPKAPDEKEWIAKSAEPGLYEAAVVQWEKDLKEYEKTPQFHDWARRFHQWDRNAHGRLVGPIEDNVYAMQYLNGSALNADHLGIDDGENR